MKRPGLNNIIRILQAAGIVVCLSAVLFISCKTGQKTDARAIREQGPEYLFEQMKKNEIRFSTFYAKFSAEAEVDNDNKSFSGAIYIIRDSVIWLSISKFGLEAARFLITEDSAKMMNRINNTYFIGDFDLVCEIFNADLDFDILQSMIVGKDVSYYDNNVFKASIDNKCYKLSTIGRRKLKKYVDHEKEAQRVLIQDIWLNPDTYKIVRVSMKEVKQQNRKFEVSYSDFAPVGDQSGAYTVRCDISDDKKKIQVTITYNRIELEVRQNIPFRIPDNYTKAEIKQQ